MSDNARDSLGVLTGELLASVRQMLSLEESISREVSEQRVRATVDMATISTKVEALKSQSEAVNTNLKDLLGAIDRRLQDVEAAAEERAKVAEERAEVRVKSLVDAIETPKRNYWSVVYQAANTDLKVFLVGLSVGVSIGTPLLAWQVISKFAKIG